MFPRKIKIIYSARRSRENSDIFIMHPAHDARDELFTFRDAQCAVPTIWIIISCNWVNNVLILQLQK